MDAKEQNPINKAIWEVIDDSIEMFNDDSKPLLSLPYDFAGTKIDISLYDKWLIHETLELKDEKQIEKRIEYLIEIIKGITLGERMKITEICIDSFKVGEFTFFQRSLLFKMIKKLKFLLNLKIWN